MEYDNMTGRTVFSIFVLIFVLYFGYRIYKGDVRFRGDNPNPTEEDKRRVNNQYKFFILLALGFASFILVVYFFKKGYL
jgi:hypothetical protein